MTGEVDYWILITDHLSPITIHWKNDNQPTKNTLQTILPGDGRGWAFSGSCSVWLIVFWPPGNVCETGRGFLSTNHHRGYSIFHLIDAPQKERQRIHEHKCPLSTYSVFCWIFFTIPSINTCIDLLPTLDLFTYRSSIFDSCPIHQFQRKEKQYQLSFPKNNTWQ